MYDGASFGYVMDWMLDHSPWKAHLFFPGINDALRYFLHARLNIPLSDVAVVEAHYVQGRVPDGVTDFQVRGRRVGHSQVWENVLDRFGIQRHSVPLSYEGERGADVLLAVEAFDRALHSPLHAVVLISGDADFVPLVERLRRRGVVAVVPHLAVDDPRGEVGRRVTAAVELVHAADHAPTWTELVTPGLDPANRLAVPFDAPTPNLKAGGARPHQDGYRRGSVNRMFDRHGFITDDSGTRWFFAFSAVKGNVTDLRVGTPVKFTGRPHPAPGRDYPQARSVWQDG